MPKIAYFWSYERALHINIKIFERMVNEIQQLYQLVIFTFQLNSYITELFFSLQSYNCTISLDCLKEIVNLTLLQLLEAMIPMTLRLLLLVYYNNTNQYSCHCHE